MKKRTALKSKESYEDTWNDALKIMQSDIINKDKHLIDILDNLLKNKVHKRFEKKFFRDFHKKLGIPMKRNQLPRERLVVQNGEYRIVPLNTILDYNFIDILAEFVQEKENQLDYVIELGSGIGINLFLLAYKLEPALRKRLRFFSCEFTDSGRKACQELLKLRDEFPMSIEYFDYYKPDFSFLSPKKNVLFITAHSIEQIPQIDRAVFTEMLEVSNQCYCYHAEPVGWQYDEAVASQRLHLKPSHWKENRSKFRHRLEKIDRWTFSRFGIGVVNIGGKFGIDIEKSDIGRSDKVSTNAAMYSFAKDYNANLVAVLKEMQSEGLIKIDTEMINLYGKNPFNPTSLISWHKIGV
ncbi:MAG: hypothetical protein JRJ12_08695 [Deltaproteobacteria bacterium]|nr:hypothetical protein [Deltaproteobacteria bacterium]MBW2069614.1 hypothetical protein [Deltaproteobacteria bacterium]